MELSNTWTTHGLQSSRGFALTTLTLIVCCAHLFFLGALIAHPLSDLHRFWFIASGAVRTLSGLPVHLQSSLVCVFSLLWSASHVVAVDYRTSQKRTA